MIGIDKPSIEALDLSEDGTYGKFVMEPKEDTVQQSETVSAEFYCLLFRDTPSHQQKLTAYFTNFRPFPVLKRMSRRLFLILRALSSRYTATVLRLSI